MIRVTVCGAAGRMGRRIIHLMKDDEGLILTGAVERSGHPLAGKDAGEIAGIGPSGINIEDDLAKAVGGCDVIIDFTNPAASLAHLRLAAECGKDMVIGSTGFSKEDVERLKIMAPYIACVFSPNMSVGVNVLFKILALITPILKDYDVEIIEWHHRFKKDAPSGTAVRLAQVIAQALGKSLEEMAIFGRQGITGERSSGEMGIFAVRAGDIVGEHTVLFGGLGERIEITHRAHSRDNFARGALLAAKFAVHADPGLYDMLDVLGLK